MTNLEYIMNRVNKLAERDLMFVLLYDQSSDYNLLGKQIKTAFQNWISKNPKSVFTKEYEYEVHHQWYCRPIKVGRPITISYQVWLSKQYDPEEWGIENERKIFIPRKA